MHHCCKEEGKRGGCQGASPGWNAASAPPHAQKGMKSWLWQLGNFASELRRAKTVPCLGDGLIPTELVCQSQANLHNSSLNRYSISCFVYIVTEVGHKYIAPCKSAWEKFLRWILFPKQNLSTKIHVENPLFSCCSKLHLVSWLPEASFIHLRFLSKYCVTCN